jgi:glutamate synthase (NADPH/NADH) large chain
VLVLNKLRSRVRIQVDGQLKTGRDVVFAALLGAEEFGFATAPLVASGCIMMRKCHLNTCPVGVATQDPELRKRFPGTPEHVIRFMFFVAEEVRELMASLGFRTIDQMVGRVECIVSKPRLDRWKLRRLDFAEVLYHPKDAEPRRSIEAQEHNLSSVKDHELIARSREAIESGHRVQLSSLIRNSDRAFGSMLSGELARQRKQPLPDDTIIIRAAGSAGQSFGAFATRGVTLNLEGDANDYVGKGLSGGIITVRPPKGAGFRPEEQVIIGNTVLYGATAGRAFFNGRAGERFAVRNSGAVAVVEGVGDHGCEYMTGGRVVVLGPIGRNFAAGMSGGVAYVLDPERKFAKLCNLEMVGVEEVDPFELESLRALIAEHWERTGSPQASELLREWRKAAARFIKVIPSEYKRVMLEMTNPATSGHMSVIELPLDEASNYQKVANA